MLDSLLPPGLDLTRIGRHMSRPKSQRGELSEHMPKRGKLARGRYWARWRIYLRQPNGSEMAKRAEKIIDRPVAEQMGFALDYTGPLTKTDAWKVLAKLIADSNTAHAVFNAKATLGELAREYIDLNKPNWESNTSRVSVQIIEDHLIGRLGARPVRELSDSELQRFINEYIEKESSRSLLSKLVTFLRAVLDTAVDRKLIDRNPARKLKAKSRKRSCNLAHTLEECDLLLAQVSGGDHLAIRLLVQLGLRSEELFALRRKDVLTNGLLIDEAVVDGEAKETKTLASQAVMYLTPNLELELQHYVGTLAADSEGWLFPSNRKGVPTRPGNFLNRVLKPAAVRAGLCLRATAMGKTTSAVNFQSLRRTSSTLFGARAKDPKSTQTHMRHTDPYVTLKHYQQGIPAEVKAAALALEQDLLEQTQKRENEARNNNANVRIV
jgi:integrase